MESIGEALKTRRTEKGLSLADVFEATKITMQNLAALEENRFDAFANRVYARAFLRDYANYLGLDSEEMLQRYESDWMSSTPVPVVKKKRSPVAAIIIAVLLLAGLGATAYYYYPKYVKSSGSTAQKPAPGPAVPKPVPAKPAPTPNVPAAKPGTVPAPGANGSTPATQPGKPAANSPAKPAQPAAKPTMVKVELVARQDVWVHIKTDGETAIIKTLKAGEKASVAGKIVSVRAGSSGALDVIVNGKNLGKFGPAGQPTTRVFKP
jgi:cytoskeletal protein RodZ